MQLASAKAAPLAAQSSSFFAGSSFVAQAATHRATSSSRKALSVQAKVTSPPIAFTLRCNRPLV